MSLTDLDRAKSDACAAQAMGLGMMELLRQSILANVLQIGGEPSLALASVSRSLKEGLAEITIDPALVVGIKTLTREDVRKRIGSLLNGSIGLVAEDLGIAVPEKPLPH